jgi:hypothetical protein
MKKPTLYSFYISSHYRPDTFGYYATATGTSYTLKTQLYTIIKGHTDNGYGGLYLSNTSDVDNFMRMTEPFFRHVFRKPNGTDPRLFNRDLRTMW